LEPLAAEAARHGRTLLDAVARPGIAGGAAFLEALGGRHAYTARSNALDVDSVDLAMVQEWVDRAKDRAHDYRLEVWDSPCPEDKVDSYLAALDVMNTAPREEL